MHGRLSLKGAVRMKSSNVNVHCTYALTQPTPIAVLFIQVWTQVGQDESCAVTLPMTPRTKVNAAAMYLRIILAIQNAPRDTEKVVDGSRKRAMG